ncbi:DUF4974 domain-containing protein [Tamlana agarivorans]|uniref:DUF4974 domain-containing protein n=1 Tax=Pseudotamlana agarivorans TaxID=481183 RepID=A0ACC5U8L6_9FLAO|nr:FecR family protein [Tamlana agarivorans]MBU2950599.1 DUF4974 domain-containing protein [Tamlana agarivorans]
MNKEIENIIVKFLISSANEEELDQLGVWLKTKENVKLFGEYIEINYALDVNFNEFDNKNVKNALSEKIKQESSVFYKYKVYNVLKYAAVVLLFFGLGFIFKEHFFETPVDAIPEIVNTNISVEPGTNKATLTLEDGSSVVLEKGGAFQTQNANSNGEEIIYNKTSQSVTEVTYNYLTIPRAGEFFIVLADGTKVWLNSESQLKYPISFVEGETRQVELVYGEAYFDVSPSELHNGTTFKVLNNAQEVEVYGTEFNIKAYKDETNIYTTLVEGKVSVGTAGVKQNLVPNQQSNLNMIDGNMTVATVDVMSEISWKNGVFSFNGKSLKDIMKVISRWYDVDVIFENSELETITFVGVLGKDQSLKTILETIKTLSIIKNYEINDKTVRLN